MFLNLFPCRPIVPSNILSFHTIKQLKMSNVRIYECHGPNKRCVQNKINSCFHSWKHHQRRKKNLLSTELYGSMSLQVSIDTDFYRFLPQIDQIIPDNARRPMYPLSARRPRHVHFSAQTGQLNYYKSTNARSRKHIKNSRPSHDYITMIDSEDIHIKRDSILVSDRMGAHMVQKDFPPRKPVRRRSNEACCFYVPLW
jgi:hypothetical protein